MKRDDHVLILRGRQECRRGRVVRVLTGTVVVKLDFDNGGGLGDATFLASDLQVISAVDALAEVTLKFKEGERVIMPGIGWHGAVVRVYSNDTVDVTWDKDERAEGDVVIPGAHGLKASLLRHECAIRQLAELGDE